MENAKLLIPLDFDQLLELNKGTLVNIIKNYGIEQPSSYSDKAEFAKAIRNHCVQEAIQKNHTTFESHTVTIPVCNEAKEFTFSVGKITIKFHRLPLRKSDTIAITFHGSFRSKLEVKLNGQTKQCFADGDKWRFRWSNMPKTPVTAKLKFTQ